MPFLAPIFLTITIVLLPTTHALADVTVSTGAATNITDTSATLMGYITSTSSNSPAQAGVEWGTTTTYGNTTTMKTFIAPGPFSTSITNPSPNTAYHFRAIAITLDTGKHTVYGLDLAFTTYAAPPHPKPTISANPIWLWAIIGVAVITIVITLIIKRKNRRPIT